MKPAVTQARSPIRARGNMRHWLSALIVVVACGGSSFSSSEGRSYRVLFIGNSLTAANDLPHTVAALGAFVDDTITVEAVTRPNLAVIDHVNGASNAVSVI